jgi:hypothetical protein
MMINPLMKCGHTAQAMMGSKPVCVVCYGIVDGANEIDDTPPDLTGRFAKCFQCGKTRESDYKLAFFQHRPDCEYDSYYSGCRGWD